MRALHSNQLVHQIIFSQVDISVRVLTLDAERSARVHTASQIQYRGCGRCCVPIHFPPAGGRLGSALIAINVYNIVDVDGHGVRRHSLQDTVGAEKTLRGKTYTLKTPGESGPRHSTPHISSPIRVMSRYSITISPGRPMRHSSLANREARKWMNRDVCTAHEVDNHILAIMPRFRFGNVVYHNPLPCQRPSPAPSLLAWPARPATQPVAACYPPPKAPTDHDVRVRLHAAGISSTLPHA